VRKGESLYRISGYDQVYGDPMKWPRIYEANTDIIKNKDLIYPDQVLRIPR
jgi:nucleoid-associated protein YgaU